MPESRLCKLTLLGRSRREGRAFYQVVVVDASSLEAAEQIARHFVNIDGYEFVRVETESLRYVRDDEIQLPRVNGSDGVIAAAGRAWFVDDH